MLRTWSVYRDGTLNLHCRTRLACQGRTVQFFGVLRWRSARSSSFWIWRKRRLSILLVSRRLMSIRRCESTAIFSNFWYSSNSSLACSSNYLLINPKNRPSIQMSSDCQVISLSWTNSLNPDKWSPFTRVNHAKFRKSYFIGSCS